MIKLKIQALCKAKAIAHPYTALKKAGISKIKTMQYLRGKTNRLMLDDMDTLCTLLRCTPNDLVEWTPKNKAEDYEENPLQAIRKKEPIELDEIIKSMTIGEIRDFKAKYEEEKRREK